MDAATPVSAVATQNLRTADISPTIRFRLLLSPVARIPATWRKITRTGGTWTFAAQPAHSSNRLTMGESRQRKKEKKQKRE
jgi:hypothetical protein